MHTKRFHTLRSWHNMLLMVWTVPFFLFPGIIVGAFSGSFQVLQVSAILALAGLLVAARRDVKKKCRYVLEKEEFVLLRGNEKRVIAVGDVIDASLIDRSSARGYIQEWSKVHRTNDVSVKVYAERFTHFCTVDIGSTSITLGFGRDLIDRLPGAKQDLVLVRLIGKEALLLSPTHPQELVDGISLRKLRS